MNIFGRGEVHPDGRGAGVWVRRSKNVRIDGIVVSQLPIGQCDSVELTNVKSISYYGWGDGMDVFSSSNVILDGMTVPLFMLLHKDLKGEAIMYW